MNSLWKLVLVAVAVALSNSDEARADDLTSGQRMNRSQVGQQIFDDEAIGVPQRSQLSSSLELQAGGQNAQVIAGLSNIVEGDGPNPIFSGAQPSGDSAVKPLFQSRSASPSGDPSAPFPGASAPIERTVVQASSSGPTASLVVPGSGGGTFPEAAVRDTAAASTFSTATTSAVDLLSPTPPVVDRSVQYRLQKTVQSAGELQVPTMVEEPVSFSFAGQAMPRTNLVPLGSAARLETGVAGWGQATEIAQTSDSGGEIDTYGGESNGDPELGIIRVRSELEDPELGVLNIREQPFPSEAQAQKAPPIAYLSGRVGFASSDNIFYAIDPLLGIVGDEFVRAGVSLSFFPKLGAQTYLIGSVDANLQRYITLSSVNYDEVRVRLGVRQILSPRSYGQLTWSYQQLFRPGLQNRFFENRSVELLLGRRDPLSERFSVDSYYRLQFNYSEPVAFDRLIHFFGVTGNYRINSQWQTGISYQVTLADYTRIDRYDTYHQLLGQLVYNITPSTRVSIFGGFSFGKSSLDAVRFEDTLYGISVESTLPLF